MYGFYKGQQLQFENPDGTQAIGVVDSVKRQQDGSIKVELEIIQPKQEVKAVVKRESGLVYVTDGKRHLVCVPYSVENLHTMADEIGIKPCWFHKNHYDIPQKRVEEIEKLCVMVHPKNIVEIIKSPKYAHIIIEDLVVGGAVPKDRFLRTVGQYKGTMD